MVLCTERSLVKHEIGLTTVTPLRCRCWSCEHCAPRRKRELKWKARNGSPSIFLTLTIRKGFAPTPDAQAVELAKGWRMLRQFICRLTGRKTITFLAVIEKHKSGWPHMHILIRGPYIDHRIIREWWASRFHSPMIWIEQVQDQRKAAIYISKYMAEDPTAFAGCKRYWCSQDWDPPKAEKPPSSPDGDVYYESVTSRPVSIAAMAMSDGCTVTFEGTTITIAGWSQVDRSRWGLR